MYSVFTIAAVLILVFGGKQVIEWTKTSEDISLDFFETTLQRMIKKQSASSFGSIDEKVIAMPAGVESVCMVDRKKQISGLINCDLNFEMEKYPNENVFLEPFGTFTPLYLELFELGDEENPLCLKSMKSTARVSVTSQGNRSLVSTFRETEKEVDCTAVLYNGDSENSIDVVFLGNGYTRFSAFEKDVNDNIKVFLDSEPFKSHSDRINFFRIDKLDFLECDIGGWIKCDEYDVKKLASFCPHDYIIVLVDRSKIKDLLSPVRSSAVGNLEKVNTADNELVVLHEFGHIFGGLADEYVDDKYYGSIGFKANEYPNCDTMGCSSWYGLEGTGCFSGCSLGMFSRPTEESIMRTLKVSEFGPLNEKIIKEKLNVYGDSR